MAIAAMTLLLFNQQLAFVRIFRAQDFLTREAPIINNYLARVVGNAEGYRLYQNIDALGAGQAPVMSGASVLVLRFLEADGSEHESILSFDDPGTGPGLYYRLMPESGAFGDPDWAVSKVATDVSFAIERGILRTYVAGPNGEEVVYSGTEQL
jgi:hypothetical protein